MNGALAQGFEPIRNGKKNWMTDNEIWPLQNGDPTHLPHNTDSRSFFLMSHVCTFAAFPTTGYVFRKYNFISKSALNSWLIANHCFWLQEAKERQEAYQKFYIEELFPEITNRYQEKHGEAFPMSGENK